jgi:hypothetical protein
MSDTEENHHAGRKVVTNGRQSSSPFPLPRGDCVVECLVAEIKVFDVILGDDWLSATRAKLDVDAQTATLMLGAKETVWHKKQSKKLYKNALL